MTAQIDWNWFEIELKVSCEQGDRQINRQVRWTHNTPFQFPYALIVYVRHCTVSVDG